MPRKEIVSAKAPLRKAEFFPLAIKSGLINAENLCGFLHTLGSFNDLFDVFCL